MKARILIALAVLTFAGCQSTGSITIPPPPPVDYGQPTQP